MNQEQKFYKLLQDTEQFIEEMLMTGAGYRDIEELVFGSTYFPGKLPCKFSFLTSFSLWQKQLKAQEI